MKLKALLTSALLPLLLLACTAPSDDAGLTAAGLVKEENKAFDQLYVRPDTDFSTYDSVYAEPLTIEFDRDWLRQQNSNNPTRINEKDKERIRSHLNRDFNEVFVVELATVNNYEVVDTPGPDTLILKPAITRLKINNPDNFKPYRITVLAEEAGSMTLNLELVEPGSKRALLNLTDNRRGRTYGRTLRVQNSVQNKQESTNMMRRWATALNEVIGSPRS